MYISLIGCVKLLLQFSTLLRMLLCCLVCSRCELCLLPLGSILNQSNFAQKICFCSIQLRSYRYFCLLRFEKGCLCCHAPPLCFVQEAAEVFSFSSVVRRLCLLHQHSVFQLMHARLQLVDSNLQTRMSSQNRNAVTRYHELDSTAQ